MYIHFKFLSNCYVTCSLASSIQIVKGHSFFFLSCHCTFFIYISCITHYYMFYVNILYFSNSKAVILILILAK